MAENVRVVVRCRPMNSKESSMDCQNIIKIEKCTLYVTNPLHLNALAKSFTFDNVYSSTALTEGIYQDICYALVENVLEGYNGTIFAYGQTGCGKTYTMQGTESMILSAAPISRNSECISSPSLIDNDRGIIVRCFDHIFETIALARNIRYLAIISYLEIYNENIRDLLQTHDEEQKIVNHQLKELPNLGVVVPTLTTHTVHNINECYQLLSLGNRNRMVAATMMNAKSSRSHTIFTICLEQIKCNENDETSTTFTIPPNMEQSKMTQQSKNISCDDTSVELKLMQNASSIRRGKLNLVDLAGSERQNKTGAIGDRLREAMKINLSLSALGNVISALVDGKTKHIPYRDSKLTRLLQDSLGGNTKTLMISCISPAGCNYDETISTLRYASRAKHISNKPRINEDPKDAKLREYQEEISKLRILLQQITTTTTTTYDQFNLHMEQEAVVAATNMSQQQKSLQSQKHLENHDMLNESVNTRTALTGAVYSVQEKQQPNENKLTAANTIEATINNSTALQLETRKRIETIKQALIGGELAHDVQLRARRQKRKMDAQRRLSALAHALSRIVQHEDRDLLQVHYANTQQEIDAKNAQVKEYRQRIRALETEVADVQAEFQVDRVDYLDTIRKLERNLKFYQQLIDKALPILRKVGKYWDPDDIIQNSSWNDDLKIWILPEMTLSNLKFPPASKISEIGAFTNPHNHANDATTESKMHQQGENTSSYIISNYFRMPRIKFNNSMATCNTPTTSITESLHFIPHNNINNIVGSQDTHTNFIEQYFRRSNVLHSGDHHRPKPFHVKNDSFGVITPASAVTCTNENFLKVKHIGKKLPRSAWNHSLHVSTSNNAALTVPNSSTTPTKPSTTYQQYTIANILNNTWSGRNSSFLLLPSSAVTSINTSSTYVTPIEHTLYQNSQLEQSNPKFTDIVGETIQGAQIANCDKRNITSIISQTDHNLDNEH